MLEFFKIKEYVSISLKVEVIKFRGDMSFFFFLNILSNVSLSNFLFFLISFRIYIINYALCEKKRIEFERKINGRVCLHGIKFLKIIRNVFLSTWLK